LKYFRASVLKDKTIEQLTKADVRNFRLRIQERILDEEISIETGNKYITRVGSMYKEIRKHYQLPLDNIFADMTFPGAKSRPRVAFDPDFIQKHILVDGLFDDLNPEARGVIYLMVETGLRPSEACNLLPQNIRLGHDIPHIVITDDERDVKSEGALRTIPLVGCALMAMKANPNGFPRYIDKEDSLSALINKAFHARKLINEKNQTLYSLRHTFKDRLRDMPETKDEFIDALMGHTDQGPRYGKGYTLAFMSSILEKMAFKPPSRV
jgi:integrase